MAIKPLSMGPVSQHSALRIPLHDLADDPRVEDLVARLVGRDLPADPGEVLVALAGGKPTHIPVGHAGRSFLERRVDEPGMVVPVAAHLEAIPDQMMDRPLHAAHVHAAREPEIGAQQVAVPVLLGGPTAQPPGPGMSACTRRIMGDLLERNGIVRQGLLGDHVAHEHNQ